MKLTTSQKTRYIIASAANFTFGYSVTVLLYSILSHALNTFVIGLLANIFGITFSFATYKWFVFKSRGHWSSEYLKCYVVYGGLAVANAAGLWILVDMIGLSVWLAPAIIMPLCFVASYLGHAKFTFRAPNA